LADRAQAVEIARQIVGRTCLAVTGQVGSLLYAALAGHWYVVEQPDQASLQLARSARACIANYRKHDRWAVAWRTVRAWGDFIMPWLGVTKLDKKGHPLSVAEEYNLCLWLDGSPRRRLRSMFS